MSDLAKHLDALRIAVAEVEALAALAVRSFDDADWSGVDGLQVERMASVLGVISRSAATAMECFHRLHTAVADAQPVAEGERWESESTASGG